MDEKWDYNKIMSDHKLFNEVVYTPLSQAIKILEERQKDKELIKKIEKLLNGDIPEPLKKIDKYGISTKQVATPNHDTLWFLRLNKEFGLIPVFSEFLEDKFVSINPFKRSLGVLEIGDSVNKKKLKEISIVDFHKYEGKSIRDVLTLWGDSLVFFHKKLFEVYNFSNDDFIFHDDSDWLKRNGGSAEKYYKKEILLYICHGILFENFLLKGNEEAFTKNIFLPALEQAISLTEMKPLIVPINLIDFEEDPCCYFYDIKINGYIKGN
jgi:hypothetical protein